MNSLRLRLALLLSFSVSACGPSSIADAGSDASTDAAIDAGLLDARPLEIPDASLDAPAGLTVLSHLGVGCTAPADSVEAVLPEEAGHYAATRLTPPSYPFRVSALDYVVGHEAGEALDCDGGLAHRVNVFVIEGTTPSASPSSDGTLARTLEVPAASVTDFRAIHLDLTPAIELTTGQSIVVAVEQAVDDLAAPTSVCCIAACPGDPAPIATVDWWSSAAMEPYAWADLVADFDYPVNLWVTASGTTL